MITTAFCAVIVPVYSPAFVPEALKVTLCVWPLTRPTPSAVSVTSTVLIVMALPVYSWLSLLPVNVTGLLVIVNLPYSGITFV